jgi:tetratricopeptide (TPR) repeat protein
MRCRDLPIMNAKSIRTLLVTVALALCAPAGWSQATPTRADGRITDSGKSLPGVQVILSHEYTFEVYRATTDKYGTFSIPEVSRGAYLVSVLNAAGDKLFRKTLALTSAPDAPIRLDIDVSGAPPAPPTRPLPSFSPSSSPAAVPAPQDEKNAAQLSSLIRQYNSALSAGDHQAEIAALEAIVAADPTRWDYFEPLGEAQMAIGDYDHAAESYEKGIEAVHRFLSSNPANGSEILESDRDRAKAGMVQMLINQANSYLKLKKNHEAIEASTKAAELAPDPATGYFNLCVMYYNTQTLEGALDACNKAIAANPKLDDAYFIEGALLFSTTKTNKDGSLTVAPGTVESLKKYLEVAPAGAHVTEVKQMLEYLGALAGASRNSGKKP